MKEEYGLFIIWSNARIKQSEIINDIKTRFEILNIFEIEWTKKIFSKNLTRFYGENLPKNSSKEQHCGNDKFILLIVKDSKPIYSYRNTSKGKKYLNVNFFDSKTMYRKWTGQHMVHGTNDTFEFEHDLMLLLGLSFEDYRKKYIHNDKVIKLKQDIIGNNGWESLEQLFYVLNGTIQYVVLRNFQKLPEEYEVGIHSDIDILCDNRENIQKILNAVPAKKSKKRSRYKVIVNNDMVYMDFRYIGDNYYDKKWQMEILNTRILNKGFYIPNNENYEYSLLYHAIVQKKKIASDYKEKFKNIFKTTDELLLKKYLYDYMNTKKYNFVDCVDYTVYFNHKITMKRMRLTKMIFFAFNNTYFKLRRMIIK